MEFSYDTGLVALSVSAAILGCFTGLVLTSGIRNLIGAQAALRIALGSIGIAGGVWSMHFIAMLAIVLPVPLSYDVGQTLLSLAVPVGFTAIALWIVASDRLGRFSLLVGALTLGLALAGMHYLGMDAIRGCGLRFSGLGIGITVLLAVQASAVALWFAFRRRGVIETLVGSAALGLATAGMHYSAMEATRFLPPAGGLRILPTALTEPQLAVAVAGALYMACTVCLVVFAVLTFNRRIAQRSYRPGITRLSYRSDLN